MRDRKDNRLCCHDKSGVLSGLARVVWSQFPTSTSAAWLLSAAPVSLTVGGGTTGDEVAISAGIGSEASELVPCSLGIVGVGKKIEIGLCYHSFLDERRKIDDATPIGFLDENDGDGGHLGGLHQR